MPREKKTPPASPAEQELKKLREENEELRSRLEQITEIASGIGADGEDEDLDDEDLDDEDEEEEEDEEE